LAKLNKITGRNGVVVVIVTNFTHFEELNLLGIKGYREKTIILILKWINNFNFKRPRKKGRQKIVFLKRSCVVE
jgi:hypothetical protein